MNTMKKVGFLFCTICLLITGCKKKEFDDYYARPESLEPPIYQVLEARGNFKNLLAIIDKGGYKNTLSKAGYWTMFAPNDAAFEQYFSANNLSVDRIDSARAQAIVQYLLVYNAFNKDRIDDFQANTGWVPDDAFRRRTAYYSGFYTDTLLNGQQVKTIASNRNGSSLPYVPADNNNKYITYFTDTYFSIKKLSASDYNYFYPASQFSGFNVMEAKVLNQNIAAENGVVHEIDKVITPALSIDEYLAKKPEYSEFRKLYLRYMVNFWQNNDATRRYQLLSGENQQVFVKVYNSSLAFSPNNENYMKLQDNDGQQDSWSIFVPKNEELLAYLKNVLLEYYDSDLANLEKLPPQVMADFLNAHMWQTALWPSQFHKTFNFLGEEARFDAQADVTDRKILSNGFFYGARKVQEANVFSSVYSRAYLDPKYSMMTRLMDAELKFVINSPNQKFTLFMMSDEALHAAGYDYKPAINEWGYTPPGGSRIAGEAVRQRLLRILNTSLVQTPKAELNNLSGSGITESYNGELIKFNNNQVISAGSADAGLSVRVDSSRVTKNGKVYYINSVLTFSEKKLGEHIQALGEAPNSSFSHFWKYLLNSSVYNPGSQEIVGTSSGSFYTLFIPANSAIEQAVKDGVLPGNKTTGVPNFAPSLPADKELVANFVLYHILNKRAVIPDGKNREPVAFETLLKNATGDVLTITVLSQNNSQLQLTDNGNTHTAHIMLPQSNNLANRTMIHLIDKYLKYKF